MMLLKKMFSSIIMNKESLLVGPNFELLFLTLSFTLFISAYFLDVGLTIFNLIQTIEN